MAHGNGPVGAACRTRCLPRITDRDMVLAYVALAIERSEATARNHWLFEKADWPRLNEMLLSMDWADFFESLDITAAVAKFTDHVLNCASLCILKAPRQDREYRHPWLNDACIKLIRDKNASEGTAAYLEKRRLCTEGLLLHHQRHVNHTRRKALALPSSSKRWWKLCNSLMMRGGHSKTIPALQSDTGEWVLLPACRAQLFADAFSKKYVLRDAVQNEFSPAPACGRSKMSGFLPVRRRLALKTLQALMEDSAAGPDLLPTRVLKRCAASLAHPVCLLVSLVLSSGQWPAPWKVHWLLPLSKQKGSTQSRQL